MNGAPEAAGAQQWAALTPGQASGPQRKFPARLSPDCSATRARARKRRGAAQPSRRRAFQSPRALKAETQLVGGNLAPTDPSSDIGSSGAAQAGLPDGSAIVVFLSTFIAICARDTRLALTSPSLLSTLEERRQLVHAVICISPP
jgi:hypothetical protein